jgi:hypothetical protein
VSESSDTLTAVMRSPTLGSEVLIPSFQALLLALNNHSCDPTKLVT